MQGKFRDLMSALFRQQGARLDISILASDEAQDFITAHSGVLDASFAQVPMSDAMRRRLTRSDYVFSGMKTFHELNEAFPSLLDENGNRKPFERFLNDVRKIDATYNGNYLRAEYNFVQASATMAAKWEEFTADGDRYNLQYRTMRDGRVRPEHEALHGVTLPITDKFWEEFYPPNGWNCRCSVVQVRKSKYPTTPHDEAMALGDLALQTDSKGMFRFNAGAERKTVPDYNPYTISRCRNCDIAKGKTTLAKVPVPESELCEACQIVRAMKENNARKNRALYESLKNNSQYKDVEYDEKSGGMKASHINHNFDKNKGWYEREVQEVGYKNGHAVVLEEESHTEYKIKSTEGTWDSLPFEIAAAETALPNNIHRALKHCAKKPDTKVAVIFFPKAGFDVNNFYDALAKFNGLKGTSQYAKFDVVYCIQGGKIVHIKKPD